MYTIARESSYTSNLRRALSGILIKEKKVPELIVAPGGNDAISRDKKRRIAPARDTELGGRK
ncbi:MAG TPA: hypothetical protein VKS20_10790 [Candidatus Acidoferrales bacterium]|nr:hypothetical protein [Candidatus Acidoferrales bacterium]